jgi:hypothetical protein
LKRKNCGAIFLGFALQNDFPSHVNNWQIKVIEYALFLESDHLCLQGLKSRNAGASLLHLEFEGCFPAKSISGTERKKSDEDPHSSCRTAISTDDASREAILVHFSFTSHSQATFL